MHALIRFEAHFANAEIIAVGTETEMIDRHAGTDIGGGIFYSVRPVEHEMTAAAAAQMAERLTPKQADALTGIADAAKRRRWVEPGSRTPSRVTPVRGFAHPTDLIAPARRLEARGFVAIDGQPYAPKRYAMTPIGRIVADAARVSA